MQDAPPPVEPSLVPSTAGSSLPEQATFVDWDRAMDNISLRDGSFGADTPAPRVGPNGAVSFCSPKG